ncbi:hypothetical protein V1286_004187 [Bradyrhizobium algeriense]|uniref:Uncharacterized protein n=1 Tax=Bradyrhizobium algeriense TaxID=634784 RepID=A0ABU8BF74_9BRAD
MSHVCPSCCLGMARPFGGMDVEKSMHLAVLLGGLLTVSIAVNAMIVLADGSRP